MISRRAFLKTGGLSVVAFGVGGVPTFVNRAAAQTLRAGGGRRKVLVALFQRGAMDGLAAVQPLADADLARLRPGLVLPPTDLIDLGQGYGLHPAFEPLADLYRDGRLAVVHGVGSPNATRSHFDAQDFMETGTPGRRDTPTGWLARAVGQLGHEATPFQSVALATALPRSLAGSRALAIADLDAFAVGDARAASASGSLEALYEQATGADDALVGAAGREAYEAAAILDRVRRDVPRGRGYPQTPLGQSLEQIARLIRADVGLDVAFAETSGWDTHVGQGSRTGSFARQAAPLARAIRAFLDDLGPLSSDVVLLTMTEFGRTVAANGSGGTDHGRASALFVVGDDVHGGRVVGETGPLAPDALADGRDLPVTTDFRAVFAGVAGGHLGLRDPAALFPGWTGTPLALVR